MQTTSDLSRLDERLRHYVRVLQDGGFDIYLREWTMQSDTPSGSVFPVGVPPELTLEAARLTAQPTNRDSLSGGVSANKSILVDNVYVDDLLLLEPLRPVAAPPASTSIVDELQRLADLHDAGHLTDDEFTAAKSRLLG